MFSGQRVEDDWIIGFHLPWIYWIYSKKDKTKGTCQTVKGSFCLCQVESQYWNNRMSLWFLQWCTWKMAMITRNLWEIAVSCLQSTHNKETELGSEVNLPPLSLYGRMTKTTVHCDSMGAWDRRLLISQMLNSEKQLWVSQLHYKSHLQSWALRRLISGEGALLTWKRKFS